MPLSAAERLSFQVNCPRCNKATEKMVAWLATNSTMRCATPDCRAIIDLDAPQYRTLIDKLAEQASEIDVLMVQLSQDNQFI
jgi:hypothetical protein